MANVVIGKIEVALEDVAHWLSKANKVVLDSPAVITALAAVFVPLDKVLADAATDASTPGTLLNVPVDVQQLQDLKAVWPAIKTAFANAKVAI